MIEIENPIEILVPTESLALNMSIISNCGYRDCPFDKEFKDNLY